MLSNGKVFFDMTSAEGEDALDGMKVDQKGNLYVSGPGGVWIISPDGKHLGTIAGPEHPHNFAWGDDDGRANKLFHGVARREYNRGQQRERPGLCRCDQADLRIGRRPSR